tara:strand:- start:94 stop:324 length:231 start_codon:yes stop_codon:yes gene_type:complete
MITEFSLILITIVWVIVGATKLKLYPFLVLLAASFFLAFSLLVPLEDIPQIFGKGFGKTFQSIGLLVVDWTILGLF